MEDIIDKIREALISRADMKIRESGLRFFKEEVNIYGLKSAEVNKIGREYYKTISRRSKSEIFELCERLWKSGYMEESFIACNWSYYVRRDYKAGDIRVFETWVGRYVNNWASCDTLCNHTVGTLVEMYPSCLSDLMRWTTSENRWMKRAAAVSLIVPARKGRFLSEIFRIADLLFSDVDDMVQKGYGWMLKSASQAHQQEVFDYVMERKDIMPRTSLRYAIEKMPSDMKKAAMVR